MSYKQFLGSYIILWLFTWVVVFVSFATKIRDLHVETYDHAYMSRSGGFGLVKHFKIHTDKDSQNGDLMIDRVYRGLTLSKIMLPLNAINTERVITFYTSAALEKTHIAATAGKIPAAKLRLYIDFYAYTLYQYSTIQFLFLICSFFTGQLHEFLFKKDVVQEIVVTEKNPLLKRISFCLMVFSLINLFF